MAFKTITVDLEACELLRSRKQPGQSFSAVIESGLRRGGTGRDLLAALRPGSLGDETIDAFEKVVSARAASPTQPTRLCPTSTPLS